MAKRHILIFGPTGSGKTGQLGELALDDYRRTGQLTRLYTADKGGWATIAGHVKAGLIQVIELDGRNPWAYAYAVAGMVPNPATPGHWHRDEDMDRGVGHAHFEGISSWASAQMLDLADRAAGNGRAIENVGGKSPIRFSSGVQGQERWVGSNNESHYGIVQGDVRKLVWDSFRLPWTVTWTSLDIRGEDKESGNPIIAPLLIGKAGVENIPSWFHLTFHLVVEPATESKPPVHRLYLCHHKDGSGGGIAYGLSNSRQPLGTDPLPTNISPANVPKALALLEGLTDRSAAMVEAAMNAPRGA
jgi:hypothetical protein